MKSSIFLKSFCFILVAAVLVSVLSISAFASDDTFTLTGIRLLVSNPDIDSLLFSEVYGLRFITGGSGYDSSAVSFLSSGTRYLGISPDFEGPSSFTSVLVYSKSSGWVNQEFRLLDFGTGVTVGSSFMYNWILNNSQDVTETADFVRGRLLGFQEGVDSSDAESKWYDIGYQDGLTDGIDSSGSASFGKNLLGDTLSAPMKALNQFTLYEASNGFEVTLGLVVGGAISLTLFIAFLKIFAGG